MSLYKRVYFLLVCSFLIAGTGYYMGCASAESTTGKLAFQQKDYIKAEAELKKGLLVDQTDDEGWYMLGVSQTELGKYDDAQRSFQKSLTISKNFADPIRSYWIEKYNAGAKDFQNGIDAETKKDKAGAKSFYEAALNSFIASSVIFPDSLRSFSAMGETYLALGQNDKAIDILNDIASKSNSPKDAERVAKVLFQSGLNLMQGGNYPSSIATFKKVLSLPSLPKNDPYYETAAYNLALALGKQGEEMRTKDDKSDYQVKFTEALQYLEPMTTSLTKKDLEPQIYELLVSVYANLGMTDKAQDALKKKDELKKN
ncbi:MAG: tetratricopeptide repeat protein [Ignavibacteria bacterium]